jgi:hypothetical protein
MAEAPFFDPYLAELQRRLQLQLASGTADLNLQSQRLTEDANLLRPFMQKRFGQQMDATAAGVAGRGLAGSSGIMGKQLGNVGEDQAFQEGMFERRISREQEDIQRAIADLNRSTTITGAEGVRQGAGNAAGRQISLLPF